MATGTGRWAGPAGWGDNHRRSASRCCHEVLFRYSRGERGEERGAERRYLLSQHIFHLLAQLCGCEMRHVWEVGESV